MSTGEIVLLSFSEGVETTAPTQQGLYASGLRVYASDAAYVTAKGSAAAAGDAYQNSTDGKIHYYHTSWIVINTTVNKFDATDAPTVDDDTGDGYEVGSLWINTTTKKLYICFDNSSGAAVWYEIIDNTNAQSIGGVKTFTDATDSTDKDTGGAIFEGGVGIEKNLNVGGDLGVDGDVTIDGDLTVSGTTTTLNTEVLDVEDANITINNGGNQTSAHDSAGITVEMSDATDVTIIYDKNLASKFKLGEVGTLKEIADVSSSQVFTNKDYDGGTASNTSRTTLPKNTRANLESLDRKEGTLVFDTESKKPLFDDGTSLTEVGSGSGSGGINYVTNGTFEVNADDWATYADAAAVRPVDGDGGSPNVTWARTTTALRGLGSALFTKDAANRQGEGVATDIEIATVDQHTPFTIKGRVNTSANYVDGDLRFYIYDITNAVLIEPSAVELMAGEYGNFRCEFQTNAGSVDYRFCIHVASTNADAYTVTFDDIEIGPSQFIYSQPRDRQYDISSYVTGTNWTSARCVAIPYKTEDEIPRLRFNIHGAVSSTGRTSYTITLSGVTFNSTANNYSPTYGFPTETLGNNQCYVNPGTNTITCAHASGTTTGYHFSGDVELDSWPTWAIDNFPVQVSDYSDNRKVCFVAFTQANQSGIGTSDTRIEFDDIVEDTHAMWDTIEKQITIPYSDNYDISIQWQSNATTSIYHDIALYKNDVPFRTARVPKSSSDSVGATPNLTLMGLPLLKGETLEVFGSIETGTCNCLGTTGGFYGTHFTLSRSGGNSVVSAGEKVYARYNTNAGQTLANETYLTVICTNKQQDSHNAYNTANGRFTAPRSSFYHLDFKARTANLSIPGGKGIQCQILKNNSEVISFMENEAPATNAQVWSFDISDSFWLDKGDYIECQPYQNSGDSTTISTTAERTSFSIFSV